MEESDASKNRCLLYKVAPNSVRTASKKLQDRYSFIGGATIGGCLGHESTNLTRMCMIHQDRARAIYDVKRYRPEHYQESCCEVWVDHVA